MSHARAASCCVDATVKEALLQARQALEASAAAVHNDPDGACDDILAARLLLDTALVRLDGSLD